MPYLPRSADEPFVHREHSTSYRGDVRALVAPPIAVYHPSDPHLQINLILHVLYDSCIPSRSRRDRAKTQLSSNGIFSLTDDIHYAEDGHRPHERVFRHASTIEGGSQCCEEIDVQETLIRLICRSYPHCGVLGLFLRQLDIESFCRPNQHPKGMSDSQTSPWRLNNLDMRYRAFYVELFPLPQANDLPVVGNLKLCLPCRPVLLPQEGRDLIT